MKCTLEREAIFQNNSRSPGKQLASLGSKPTARLAVRRASYCRSSPPNPARKPRHNNELNSMIAPTHGVGPSGLSAKRPRGVQHNSIIVILTHESNREGENSRKKDQNIVTDSTFFCQRRVAPVKADKSRGSENREVIPVEDRNRYDDDLNTFTTVGLQCSHLRKPSSGSFGMTSTRR